MATGFQQLMEEEDGEWHEHPENIYGNIEKCIGENADYFHGNTNLNGGLCIYS
ncbi:MAG: hypothetical protein J6W35_07740 [Eubacterium sp.]|nr:hypothetical protein [Eubacterium sp.]